METVEVDGLRIAYRRTGTGPALLLVHGGLGDSRDWRRQLEGLGDEFTVVAWDAPGCGGSDDPPETFRLPDYADCLAGVAAALGIGRPHVCGLSFGGGLALELYRRHPGLPRSLVLASAYAGWAGSLPPEVVRERLDQVMREAELPPERWVRGYLPGLFTEAAPRALLEEAEAIMLDARPAGMRAMALSFAEADLRDLLPGIRVPTLLLYGDVDRRSPQAASPPSCTAASRDRGWWSCQGSGMPPTWRPPIASTPRCASSCAPFRKLRGWTRER